jgi:hypothetical protein
MASIELAFEKNSPSTANLRRSKKTYEKYWLAIKIYKLQKIPILFVADAVATVY